MRISFLSPSRPLNLSVFLSVSICVYLRLSSIVFSDSLPPESWNISLESPERHNITIRRGDSFNIQPSFLSYGSPFSLTNYTAVELRYRSAAMTTNYYMVTGTVYNASSGIVQVAWTPSAETIETALQYNLIVRSEHSSIVRAWGNITLTDSIGNSAPATNPAAYSSFPWVSDPDNTDAPSIRWFIDLERPAKKDFEIRRGDTFNMEPSLRSYGSAFNLTNATTVELRYKSANMITNYYAITGSVYNATGGVARIRWSAAAETVTNALQYDLYILSPSSTIVRAWGNIALIPSVGYLSTQADPAAMPIAAWASIYDPAAGRKQVAFSADLGTAARANTNDFASVLHSHSISDIMDLLTTRLTLNGTNYALSGEVGGGGSFATITGDVNDNASLSNALAAKQPAGNYLQEVTNHNQSYTTITGLGSAATSAAGDFATAAQGLRADSAAQPYYTNLIVSGSITPDKTGLFTWSPADNAYTRAGDSNCIIYDFLGQKWFVSNKAGQFPIWKNTGGQWVGSFLPYDGAAGTATVSYAPVTLGSASTNMATDFYAAGSTVVSASNSNYSAISGTASGIVGVVKTDITTNNGTATLALQTGTTVANATADNNPVSLAQLRSVQGGNLVLYASANKSIAYTNTLTPTNATYILSESPGPYISRTNAIGTNEAYISASIYTNRSFTSFQAGSVNVGLYCCENDAGNQTIKVEAYRYEISTGNLYEWGDSAAANTVTAGTTPTLSPWTIPVSAVITNSPWYFVARTKRVGGNAAATANLIFATGTGFPTYVSLTLASDVLLAGYERLDGSTGPHTGNEDMGGKALTNASTIQATGGFTNTNESATNYFAGRVGIGTNAPNAALLVVGNYPQMIIKSTNSHILINMTSETNAENSLNFQYPSGEWWKTGLDNGPNGTLGDYTIKTNNNGDANLIVKHASGNVGIATNLPLTKLSVDGNVSIGTAYAAPTAKLGIAGTNRQEMFQYTLESDNRYRNSWYSSCGNANVSWVSLALATNANLNLECYWFTPTGLVVSVNGIANNVASSAVNPTPLSGSSNTVALDAVSTWYKWTLSTNATLYLTPCSSNMGATCRIDVDRAAYTFTINSANCLTSGLGNVSILTNIGNTVQSYIFDQCAYGTGTVLKIGGYQLR